MKIEIK